jgi:2-polyprenyl-3-methyl-5-hydroxy-6-metoxy-1,4-benzoquinol methylase
MDTENRSVIEHYKRKNIMPRILDALSGAGHDPDNLTITALSEVDHLHGGALATTVAQAELAAIPKGCHVLDAGCGICGPSRYLADSYGCTIEAFDLTPEFVEVARQLNEKVGLGDKITVEVGSVTELRYVDQSFDVVLSQNVSMNVADKSAMFNEAFRVLKPGGIFTFSHLAEGPNGPPIYPLPWARTPDVSFLETPQKITDLLSAAGFVEIEDKASIANSKPGGPPPPGTIGGAPAMGDDLPMRIQNSLQSHQEGRLIPMMIVARRPY